MGNCLFSPMLQAALGGWTVVLWREQVPEGWGLRTTSTRDIRTALHVCVGTTPAVGHTLGGTGRVRTCNTHAAHGCVHLTTRSLYVLYTREGEQRARTATSGCAGTRVGALTQPLHTHAGRAAGTHAAVHRAHAAPAAAPRVYRGLRHRQAGGARGGSTEQRGGGRGAPALPGPGGGAGRGRGGDRPPGGGKGGSRGWGRAGRCRGSHLRQRESPPCAGGLCVALLCFIHLCIYLIFIFFNFFSARFAVVMPPA